MAVESRSTGLFRPEFGFLGAVEEASHQPVSSCFRCLKCSAGCPMSGEMDYPPDRLIRMVQLGLRQQALQSRSIWLCTGCVACSERCPNGIDVARVIDTLKEMATRDGVAVGDPRIAAFHRSFLGTVRRYGRLHEATLIALLKVRGGDWTADVGAGLRLFAKGKIPLVPQRIRAGGQVARLFDAAGLMKAEPPAGEGR